MKRNKTISVIDKHQQKNKIPKDLDRYARLSVINSRLFIILLIMSLIVLYSVHAQHKASVRADNSIKVAWVKVYPDGTWDVSLNEQNREPEIFQTTIDYMLRNWVIRRFSKIPYSIKSDYGFAYIFMSEALQNEFISPEGYDAANKAADIANCSNCPTENITVRTIDHFDSDETNFNNQKGTLYRSNIFATKEKRYKNGSIISSEKIIIPIQWRIKTTEEIQSDKESLKENPIGLEILDYELLIDKSTESTENN